MLVVTCCLVMALNRSSQWSKTVLQVCDLTESHAIVPRDIYTFSIGMKSYSDLVAWQRHYMSLGQ